MKKRKMCIDYCELYGKSEPCDYKEHVRTIDYLNGTYKKEYMCKLYGLPLEEARKKCGQPVTTEFERLHG